MYISGCHDNRRSLHCLLGKKCCATTVRTLGVPQSAPMHEEWRRRRARAFHGLVTTWYRSIAPSAQSDVRHPSYEPEVRGCDKEGTGDSHLGGTGDALYDTKNLQMHNSCATVLQSCLFFAFYPDIQVNYGIWDWKEYTHGKNGCVNFTLTP